MPIKHIIRIFIGCVFIASSVLKMMDVDAFEVYIFSQQWISLSASSILARAVISGEALLGALLIIGWRYRLMWSAALGVLIVFSAFLIVQVMQGETENCYCFGSALSLSPTASLIKNGILLLLLWIIRPQHYKGWNWQHASNAALFIAVFTLATPSLLSPPDFLLQYPEMPEKAMETANARLLQEPVLHATGIDSGKVIVCMFSIQCTYCKQAAGKISTIAKRHGIEEHVLYVFTGDPNELPGFWEESRSEPFPYVFLPMRTFFSIAGPSVPSIYLVRDGKIEQHFHFRTISEQSISDFCAS